MPTVTDEGHINYAWAIIEYVGRAPNSWDFVESQTTTTDADSVSAQGGIERATGEDGLQGGQERLALLAKGRQVASEPGEGVRAGIAAEAAGDLLLRLEGSQVALGLVPPKILRLSRVVRRLGQA